MDNYYVYRHINRCNGKQYIGITMQVPEARWGVNGSNYRESPHFWSAICKYGWDSFDHEILYSELSKEKACEIEKQLIKEFNTQNREFGYNVFEGGDAPSIPSETRKKMSNSIMGNKNGLGHPCSEEKRKKISDAQKGRRLTEEHKKKLSLAKRADITSRQVLRQEKRFQTHTENALFIA